MNDVDDDINPWRQWHGAWVPEWLMRSKAVSPGAKLCYARLCRYAGKEGVAYPDQAELAEELAVSERTVRTYIRELEDAHLIRTEQRGLGQPNRYRFRNHPMIWNDEDGPDRKDPAGLDRKDSAAQERKDPAGPSSLRESSRESSSRASRRDVVRPLRSKSKRRVETDEGDDLERPTAVFDGEPAEEPTTVASRRRRPTTVTLVDDFARRSLQTDLPVSARTTQKGALGKSIKKWITEGADVEAIARAMDTFFLTPAAYRLEGQPLWLGFINHYPSLYEAATTQSMADPDYYKEKPPVQQWATYDDWAAAQ